MRTLAESVLEYIRKHALLKAGDRVGAAVSGGADSVAMLRLLLELRRELGVVLMVVHFNHQLRGTESDADEQFVTELGRRHKLDVLCESGDVAARATEKHLSLEAAGREMRYAYFLRLLRAGRADRIATAHTLDDQAETVLLRVARGAGTRGLAGIYPQLSVVRSQFSVASQFSVLGSQFSEGSRLSAFSSQEDLAIIRPLLGVRRRDLESYLNALGQDWREDSSNRDLRHARNRVRHGILPRLERNLNPAVREALAETAEIARAEEAYWHKEVERVLPSVWETAARSLRLTALVNLPLALQRRVIRAAGESLGVRLDFQHVEKILGVGSGAARAAELPNGWRVSRHKDQLRFEPAGTALEAICADYEYPLTVPGRVEVPEVGRCFEAVAIPGGAAAGYNREHFLDPAVLAKQLVVRNWRAGDRFWPAHTKAPRKIKELLQERHLTGAERKLWPVVVSADEVIWVRGFAVPERVRARDGGKGAVVIRETET